MARNEQVYSLLLIDTNIAIHLRDGDITTLERFACLLVKPQISIVTQIELEGGIVAKPYLAANRRAAVDALLLNTVIHPYGPRELAAYRQIVEAAGYSRPRILDRMIAATALVHNLTLATMNGGDFTDIPGLRLEIWPTPDA